MADDAVRQQLAVTGSGASTIQLTLLSSVLAASLLHAWAVSQASNASGVSDDINGAYTSNTGAQASHSGSVMSNESYYLENAGAGSTTVTATFGATTDMGLHVAEVLYVATSSALDKTAASSNQAATATPTSGTTAATTQNNEWVTASLMIRLSTMSSYSAGYVVSTDSVAVNGRRWSVGSQTVITTGTQVFSASASAADDACGAIATFKITPPEPRPIRVGGVPYYSRSRSSDPARRIPA